MSQLQVTGEAKIRDIQGPVVANSGVITALDGAASQYVRGDGTLADFPTSTGGGSSVSYYLNSSVSQGTIGGVAYRELSKDPIIGAGTDITISANGYVANYITDANDPDVTIVPGGNFNCEFYFSVNNNTGNPTTYAELYKYDGTTFTLLGTSAGVPESINQGTTIAPYYFAIPVATAPLSVTDRLAIRIYVSVDGRTVTLHTENGHLCQVVTTLSKGMVSLNNLTDQSQYLTTGTSGTNFAIVSSGDTHTFNLPVASATNTGKLSNTDWSTFNAKQPAGNYVTLDTTQTITAAKTISGLLTVNNKIYLQTDLSTTGVYLQSYNSNEFSIGVTSGATTYYSDFILQGANRYYTFPNIDGTIALLEGTQTFSGSKTFSAALKNDAGVLLKNGFTTYSNGYTSLSGDVGNLVISGSISSTPFDNELAFTPSTSNTYTFPNASGTIALTSNIPANIVTGTGTTNTLPKFTGTSTVGNSNITDTGSLITLSSNVTTTGSQFVQNGFYLTNANAGATAGYTHMWGADDGIFFGLRNATGGAKFVFQSATSYNYTFPAATGTLALTSNLSAYLPLTGGTLTGALNGTSATFSSTMFVNSPLNNTVITTSDATNITNGFNLLASSSYWGIRTSTNGNFNLDVFGAGVPKNALIIAQSTGAATFSSTLQVGGTGSSTITIGDAVGSAADSNLRLRTGSTKYAWLIASQNNVAGFEITPSTAVGGTTFSTPALSILPTGAATFSSSVTATNGIFSGEVYNTTTGAFFIANAIGNTSYPTYGFYNNAGVGMYRPSADVLGFVTSSTERMRITSGGDVAIGDTSASANLWVKNSGAGNTFGARNTNASFGATIGFFGADRNTTNNSFYYIDCYNYGSSSYRFRVADSGAVTASNSITASSTGTGTPAFFAKADAGSNNGTYGFGNSTDYRIRGGSDYGAMIFDTAGSERMRITSSGSIGIGTTNPFGIASSLVAICGNGSVNNLLNIQETANVASTAFLQFLNSSGGVCGNVVRIALTNAVNYNTTSDYRLKEDLKEIKGLEKISAIKVYDFKWKGIEARMDGVIAHELAEILPYAVSGEKDGEKMQGVDYSKIVPVLVKAIQEQQAQIEELKALIAAK